MTDLQRFASEFVESTRDFVFVRPEDRLLILRPNRTHYLNATACEMLQRLYRQSAVDVPVLVGEMALEYGVDREQVARDLEELLKTLNGLLRDDYSQATRVKFTPFGSHQVKYPVLSEIALTYRCQHRCPFCYADSPRRGAEVREMTTEGVCRVIDRIYDEAKVPTVSFTGGEPTLRDDLPDLIRYAKSRGMRTNLITNGYRLADEALARKLVASGLDSAQVSVEGPTALTHDAVTGTPGSFDRSLQGIRHLRACGIHTHTNTTICPENRDHVIGMPDLARDLGHDYLSMNMVIRTGGAADGSADTISYGDIGSIVAPIQERCRELGLRLVWYSPVPYCVFNPVTIGLGSNSCAAADGLLSVAPDGQLLPCSSFETGVGSLLNESFDTVWNRRTARYWRQKEFLPPVCADCDLKHICCGACPLYWDEQQGFDALPGARKGRVGFLRQTEWRLKRRWLGRLKGVNLQ